MTLLKFLKTLNVLSKQKLVICPQKILILLENKQTAF